MNNSQQLLAIRLNNLGVASIHNGGDFQQVISYLSDAVKTCKETMISDVDNADIDIDDTKSIFNLTDCMAVSPGIISHVPLVDTTYLSGNKHSFIYQHAIVIPESSVAQTNTCPSNKTISGIVIFNLALTYHLYALKTHAPQKLRKAAKLYGLGFDLHNDTSVSTSPIFLLATINNMGHVYQSLKEAHLASTCFDYLLSTLMYMVDSGQGACIQKGEDLGDFFENTTDFICQQGRSPAPAA
jgi:hypothetical protein